MYHEERFRNILLEKLQEREKELNCLYSVIEILKDKKSDLKNILSRIAATIPNGFQHPTVCEVKITLGDTTVQTRDFRTSEWKLEADIVVDKNVEGSIELYYTQFIRLYNNRPFLPEEQLLLNTIADRIGSYVFSQRLKKTVEALKNSASLANTASEKKEMLKAEHDEHAHWRKKAAQFIAQRIDTQKLGIKAIYLAGSTKNATAGPCSDIDLIVHFDGTPAQRELLKTWFDGCSHCLDFINQNRTGYTTESGLIDLHIITDKDIEQKSSFAVMLTSLDNTVLKLR